MDSLNHDVPSLGLLGKFDLEDLFLDSIISIAIGVPIFALHLKIWWNEKISFYYTNINLKSFSTTIQYTKFTTLLTYYAIFILQGFWGFGVLGFWELIYFNHVIVVVY